MCSNPNTQKVQEIAAASSPIGSISQRRQRVRAKLVPTTATSLQVRQAIQTSTLVDGRAAREEPLGINAERERLARTIEVWSPRSSRPLTEEDARKICENVLGFFRVLIEWKAKQAASTSGRDRDAA